MFDRPFIGEDIHKDWWRTCADFAWTNGPFRHVIPAGTYTDFLSIPAFAAVLGFDDDDFPRAAGLHDHLYQVQTRSRKFADRQLFAALVADGCGRGRAWIMWLMVRLFGWVAWREHQKRNAEKARGTFQIPKK